MKQRNSLRIYQIILIILLTFWCIGMISPVIFQNEHSYLIAKPFLNQIYSTVCHQQAHKTINVGEDKILVCSRCAGIYFGVWIAAILSLFVLPKKHSFDFLILTFILLLFDVALAYIRIYNYSKLTAAITGLLFGSSVLLFLLNELHHNKFLVKHEK